MSTIITPPPTGNRRRQAGARPTRDKRRRPFVTQFHNGRNFRRRLRKHSHVRAVLFNDKRVALIDGQIGLCLQHPIWSEQLPQLIGEIGGLDRIHN